MLQCLQRFSVFQWFLCAAAIGPSPLIWLAPRFRRRRTGKAGNQEEYCINSHSSFLIAHFLNISEPSTAFFHAFYRRPIWGGSVFIINGLHNMAPSPVRLPAAQPVFFLFFCRIFLPEPRSRAFMSSKPVNSQIQCVAHSVQDTLILRF